MDVAVLISGVTDPRYSLPGDLSGGSLQLHVDSHSTLSPFDEAALGLCLSLRDADPEVRITALVASGEALARTVLGWRPDVLHRLDLGAIARWDNDLMARTLSVALRELAPQAALVLVGREFGDYDDGSVPASLAQLAGSPYIALALRLQRAQGTWSALRQATNGLERVQLPSPALLSVTNDPGNRLRHPLLKNVMMAKKAAVPVWQAAACSDTPKLCLQAMVTAAEPARHSACEWLAGSPEEKARALAKVLLAQARA